jgi:hypothetical protein
MSLILVQPNDYRIVLDERDVQPADIDDEKSAANPQARKPPFRRVAVIVPVRDYRAVIG